MDYWSFVDDILTAHPEYILTVAARIALVVRDEFQTHILCSTSWFQFMGLVKHTMVAQEKAKMPLWVFSASERVDYSGGHQMVPLFKQKRNVWEPIKRIELEVNDLNHLSCKTCLTNKKNDKSTQFFSSCTPLFNLVRYFLLTMLLFLSNRYDIHFRYGKIKEKMESLLFS